jgi:hypothetical protein
MANDCVVITLLSGFTSVLLQVGMLNKIMAVITYVNYSSAFRAMLTLSCSQCLGRFIR